MPLLQHVSKKLDIIILCFFVNVFHFSKDQIMKKSVSEHAVEPVERQRDLEMKKKVEDHNVSAALFAIGQ